MSVNVIRNDAASLTNGEEKVLRMLKKLYTNAEHEVYIYVQQIVSGKRPDFIIFDSKRGIGIIEVKDWSIGYIKELSKTEAILENGKDRNPLYQVKTYYKIINGLLCTNEDIDVMDNIFGIAMLVDLSESDIINGGFKEYLNQPPMICITSDKMSLIGLDDLFNFNDIHIKEDTLIQLRTTLFPEIKIVKRDEDEGSNKVDIKALDESQESFARRIPLGNYMVSGIPGSGKTVMLMARAVHLVKENPNWNVLILTYNKSLRKKLKSNLDKLARDINNNLFHKDINIDNIEILNFHQLTYRLTNGMKKPSNIDSNDWWNINVVEEASKIASPQYDAILIDEYQDFRDNWIKLCIKCCKPYKIFNSKKEKVEVVNLFMAGDRLQSIYNPKEISWRSLGIDMRGRSKLLKTSYRATSDSMNIALEFLQKDNELSEEVQKFYKDEGENEVNIKNINKGTIEFLEGSYNSITNKIEELIEKCKYNYNEVLVLCKSKYICQDIINNLDAKYRYISTFVQDIEPDEMNNRIIFTTYQSAKGLESKVVILVDVDKFKGEKDSDKDCLSRKLLYVGMTRASEKLYIHANSYTNNSFAKDIKELSTNIKK